MARPEGTEKPRAHPTGAPNASEAVAAGVDAGASLAKIALRGADGALHFHLERGDALDEVARRVSESGAALVGATGCGAAALGALREGSTLKVTEFLQVNEFAAWGRGAAALLPEGRGPHLLVSLGTGTSVMLADGLSVNRIGGTALGGGTLLGLGTALLACTGFEELAALAERGSRHRVDLLVSDIYRPGEIALPGDITAANFGKLARLPAGAKPEREDLAHGLMGMVGENVALICAGLAATHRVPRTVFGGATLRNNPALTSILHQITTALGGEASFMPDGEYAGALGALLLAEASQAGASGGSGSGAASRF